jgi:exonuclease SbcC
MNNQEIRLSATNFRRLAHIPLITFLPGLNIITGENGSGKSTLAELIGLALFGAKRGTLKDMRTDDAASDWYVECEFFIDGQRVKILRTGREATLWIDDILQVQGGPGSAKAVQHRVNELLGGLTREQFEQTYVALQGDTAGLVDERYGRERRKIIERALQGDVLHEALSQQKERRTHQRHRVLARAEDICMQLHLDDSHHLLPKFEKAHNPEKRILYIQEFIAAIGKYIGAKQKGIEEAEKQLSALCDERTRHQEEFERLQQGVAADKDQAVRQEQLRLSHQRIEDRILHLKGQLAQTERDITAAQAAVQQAEQCLPDAEEYKQSIEQSLQIEERLRRLLLIKARAVSLSRVQAKMKAMETKLKQFQGVDEELRQISLQITALKQKRDKLFNENPLEEPWQVWQEKEQKLRIEIDHNREAIDLLTNHAEDATCPVCNQHFVEHTPQQRLQHLQAWREQQLPRLRQQLSEEKQTLEQKKTVYKQQQLQAEQEWQQAAHHLTQLQEKAARQGVLLLEHQELNNELQQAQQEWNDLQEETYDPTEEEKRQKSLVETKARIVQLEKAAKQYEQLPVCRMQLAEKQQRQAEILQAIHQAQDEQKAIGYCPMRQQQIVEAIEQNQEAFNKKQQQLFALQTRCMQMEQEVNGSREALQMAQSCNQQIRQMAEASQKEDCLYLLLDAFVADFYGRNTQNISQRTAELLRLAITDQSILDVKITDNDFFYMDCSHTLRSMTRLSGGEKSLVGLCLRIALAEQAQCLVKTGKLNFLILDEVLSSLDDERCTAVQQILEDVQRRGIFQHIIMITHLDRVKHGWPGRMLEVRKDGPKTSTVVSITPQAPQEESNETSSEQALVEQTSSSPIEVQAVSTSASIVS